MRRFLRILETCYEDEGLSPMEEKGDRIVIDALKEAGVEVKDSETGCFDFVDEEGTRYTVTVEETVEDEESPEDEASDSAARAVKIADKATGDNEQTAAAKDSLSNQVTKTYNDLTNGLRTASSKIRI